MLSARVNLVAQTGVIEHFKIDTSRGKLTEGSSSLVVQLPPPAHFLRGVFSFGVPVPVPLCNDGLLVLHDTLARLRLTLMFILRQ